MKVRVQQNDLEEDPDDKHGFVFRIEEAQK